MAERLKELLEKINQEGIKQAEENKSAIESKAQSDAAKIIEDAKIEAGRIVEKAKLQAKKTKESSETTIKQAGRDLILSLKDEIRKILNKIVASDTKKALSNEKELSGILGSLIERYIEKNGESSDIKVLLKKDDLEKLKDNFISKLTKSLKDGIEFKPSPNINAGFSISFDKGKSFFDFTDEGLREALSTYLNPELSKLLK